MSSVLSVHQSSRGKGQFICLCFFLDCEETCSALNSSILFRLKMFDFYIFPTFPFGGGKVTICKFDRVIDTHSDKKL